MLQPSDMPDVIVVGGGLAGLTAATHVALSGQRVTVFERSEHLGGRARTTAHGPYRLNFGPHALYQKGIAARILRQLGVKWSGRSPGSSTFAGGLSIRNGVPPTTFIAAALSPIHTQILSVRAKAEVVSFLARLRKLKPDEHHGVPVTAWLEQTFRSDDARRFVGSLVRLWTYAGDLDRLSAAAAIRQGQLALLGNVEYVDGGWQSLVDGLSARARDLGVEIVTGAKVSRIRKGDRDATVELAEGVQLTASAVILATSPRVASALVDGGQNKYLARWAKECVPCDVACLDVALHSLPRKGRGFALGVDKPLYMSNHATIAKLAPQKGAVVHVAKYLSYPCRTDPEAVEQELHDFLERVQPGWREMVVYRRFLPSLRVMHGMPVAGGGVPGPEVPNAGALFVAGDWVGRDGLLADRSVASALEAARLALRRVGNEQCLAG